MAFSATAPSSLGAFSIIYWAEMADRTSSGFFFQASQNVIRFEPPLRPLLGQPTSNLRSIAIDRRHPALQQFPAQPAGRLLNHEPLRPGKTKHADRRVGEW